MQPISKSGFVKSGILAVALLALGGCVYGPDYGYVRGDGYSGMPTTALRTTAAPPITTTIHGAIPATGTALE